MKRRLKLLFVDDEKPVLLAISRMLHRMSREWDIRFANSGLEALEMLASETVDVVVSDMRMPGMNGAQLLEIVRSKYPDAIRLILSGYSDQAMIMQTTRVAHQFLAKPCDPDRLRSTILRILNLRGLMKSSGMHRFVAGIDQLPSPPALYEEIARELTSNDPRIDLVIGKIENDPALSMKVLQLVNSAFFGLSREVSDISDAVCVLGVEVLQSLILFSGMYSKAEERASFPFSFSGFANHAIAVGRLAQKVGLALGVPPLCQKEAFTAGILHDSGKLILALYGGEKYSEIFNRAKETGESLSDLEMRAFDVSHGEIGSYLLGLWGFSSSLMEAVAFHHQPSASVNRDVDTLALVHLANGLAKSDLKTGEPSVDGFFDQAYLDALGIAERMPELFRLRTPNQSCQTARMTA